MGGRSGRNSCIDSRSSRVTVVGQHYGIVHWQARHSSTWYYDMQNERLDNVYASGYTVFAQLNFSRCAEKSHDKPSTPRSSFRSPRFKIKDTIRWVVTRKPRYSSHCADEKIQVDKGEKGRGVEKMKNTCVGNWNSESAELTTASFQHDMLGIVIMQIVQSQVLGDKRNSMFGIGAAQNSNLAASLSDPTSGLARRSCWEVDISIRPFPIPFTVGAALPVCGKETFSSCAVDSCR